MSDKENPEYSWGVSDPEYPPPSPPSSTPSTGRHSRITPAKPLVAATPPKPESPQEKAFWDDPALGETVELAMKVNELEAANKELAKQLEAARQETATAHARAEAEHARALQMILALQKGEIGTPDTLILTRAIIALRNAFREGPPPELAKRLTQTQPAFWRALVEFMSALDS